jgi:3-oxoacyl-[acyl-carrier-protein] synthase II
MAAYIRGVAIISPQKTFGDQGFPDDIVVHSGNGFMKCIEPAYRDFIDPMVARRMSRIVKMGISSALKCLRNSDVPMPDAIITGTGLGCLDDTEKFLASIHNNEEKLLNPTPFIQSTHNTVAGAIALAIKCHGYNATYTQRGFSFESALEDALLQIDENQSKNILVGGFDEITETSYSLTSRLGLWKNHIVDSSKLYEYNTRGSLPGEGAAFFMLRGSVIPGNSVRIRMLKLFYEADGINDINERINGYLNEDGIDPGNIDLIMLGISGDNRTDHYYYHLISGIFNDKPVTGFKHLCGEYDTSASFALWYAWHIIRNQKVMVQLLKENPLRDTIDSILIYNHLWGKYHSLYLLERC